MWVGHPLIKRVVEDCSKATPQRHFPHPIYTGTPGLFLLQLHKPFRRKLLSLATPHTKRRCRLECATYLIVVCRKITKIHNVRCVPTFWS